MSGPAPQPRHMTPSPPTFLESLTAVERDALLSAGHVRRWSVGEVLFREGDTAGSAIVIVSGLVKIHKRGRDGDELILSLCGPGDLLGEVTAVQGAARSADAVALEDVEAATVTVADLRALLARYPRVALVLLELALRRLRLADQHRLEFAAAESLPRVTSRLLELGRAVRRGWAGRDARGRDADQSGGARLLGGGLTRVDRAGSPDVARARPDRDPPQARWWSTPTVPDRGAQAGGRAPPEPSSPRVEVWRAKTTSRP